jgi:hypothetical protein
MAVDDPKASPRPRVGIGGKSGQAIGYVSQFLQGHPIGIPQDRQGSQRDDISKGVDPAKRTPLLIVSIFGMEEPTLVPIAKLPSGQAGQTNYLVSRKREQWIH